MKQKRYDKKLKTYQKFIKIFKKIGIKKGDILYVASDLLKILVSFRKEKKELDLDIFINTLIKSVGSNGTILIPTYNWDFCKKKSFDIKNTKSECGALSNHSIKRKDFKRTKHPIYSFAVWGKYKNLLVNLKNRSAWSANSPFDFLFKKKAKNLFIGIDYKEAFTMDHYFEQKVNVKYRYHKTFTSKYIDEKNSKKIKKYTMFVRKTNLCDTTKISNLLDVELIKIKALKKIKLKNVLFSLIDLNLASKIIIDDLKKEKSNFIYPIKN